MKNINIFLIGAYILLCLGCNRSDINSNPNYKIKEFTFEDFKKEINLKGRKHNLTEFLNPRNILALDDYLIVNQNGLDELFYIYRTSDLSFYRKMGKNGLGPDEITMCNSLYPGKEKDEFWAYDSNIKQYAGYKIEAENSTSFKQIRQGDKLYSAVELVHTSDSTIMTKLAVGDDMFVEFSTNADTINKFGKWKFLLDNKQPDHFNYKILQGRLNSSKDRNWFTLSGVAKDYIELLNKESGKIVSIRGPFNENPEYLVKTISGYDMPVFKQDTKTNYPQTFIGEKSIFALFFGKPNHEVLGVEDSEINIFEFDLEGNPLTNYIITYPIISFTINEDLKKIYGISLDKNPNIVEFNY